MDNTDNTHAIKLTINGAPWEGRVPADLTLLRFLREQLALTGAKEGCGIGECGACTVLLDGRPVNACSSGTRWKSMSSAYRFSLAPW